MGYNTTVVVHNDALEAIGKDVEFGKKLRNAITGISIRDPKTRRVIDVSAGSHVNAAEVVEAHHADDMRLVAVGGNLGYDLGYAGDWRLDPDDSDSVQRALDCVARVYGLKVIKDPKRKRSI